MEQERILTKLSENRQLLQAYGIKDIRLFGSVARGEAEKSAASFAFSKAFN
jgi:predicted nucleotidyltransferase